jgi:hypothetical protein
VRYRFTNKPAVQWGEDNLFEDGEPMMVAHDRANRPIARLQLMDQDGRALTPEEIVVTQGRKRSSGAAARGRRARARQ